MRDSQKRIDVEAQIVHEKSGVLNMFMVVVQKNGSLECFIM